VPHNTTSVRIAVRLALAAFGILLLGGVASADADAICKCGCLFKVKGGNWFGADRSGKYTCPDCQRKGATGPQAPGANAGYNGPRDANTKTGTAAPGPRLPNTDCPAYTPAPTPRPAGTPTPRPTPNAATAAAGGIAESINFLNGGNQPADRANNTPRYSNTKPK
jgi:hypothetical protein